MKVSAHVALDGTNINQPGVVPVSDLHYVWNVVLESDLVCLLLLPPCWRHSGVPTYSLGCGPEYSELCLHHYSLPYIPTPAM